MHHMVTRGQKTVTIYRGVPVGVNEIRPGDWVALSASYAQAHERGKVLSMRVPAEDVAWAGTDKNEYFYVPRGAMSESDTSGGKRKLPGRVGETPFWVKPMAPMTKKLGLGQWNEGGCFAFAEVLAKSFGGKLWGICSRQTDEDGATDFPVEHAIVKIAGRFYDYRGLLDVELEMRTMEAKNGRKLFLKPASNPSVFWFEDEFLDDDDFAKLANILSGKTPKMTEAHQPTTDKIDEALWWVSRWVSGSETDPDWDYGGSETMTMDEAFIFLSETIKSKFKNIPVLYRAIVVSNREAEKIIETKRLSTNHRSFQSFTTSAKIAIKACYDIDSFIGKGNVRLLVEVRNPPVLFALLDLKRTSIWGQLADWHHQGEVFVDGRKPLTIEKATVIKNA